MRNVGGHTKAASYHSFPSNARILGAQEAIKIAQLEYNNIRAVHGFAREKGIECDSWEGETVDVFYDRGQFENAKKAIQLITDSAKETGNDLNGWASYDVWDQDEVVQRFGVNGKGVVGGVSYYAGSIHAYKFVIGLLKRCLELQMTLFTETPVSSVEQGADGKWIVVTKQGVIRANRVVLATNAYTAFLKKDFQGSIVPLRGQVTVQRPGKEMHSIRENLAGTYSFVYKEGYDYMIRRPQGTECENQMVIGGGLTKAAQEGLYEYGNTDDSTLNSDISAYLRESLLQHFGVETWGEDHKDGRVMTEWSGIMGYSPDGYPFVGQVVDEDGLWVSAGFQGHGMVLCFMCDYHLNIYNRIHHANFFFV